MFFMAWPAGAIGATPAGARTDTKTSLTMGRSVDSVLWPMLCAKSQLLDRIPKFPVDNTYFEWESVNTNSRIVTCSGTTDTNIDGSGSATALVLSSAAGLQEGAILRNASRATPIGTYGADEIMQVTAISTNTLTVVRDYGRQNSGTGSTAHVAADNYEVLYTPKEEGSSPDENKYKDVSLTGNYTTILDFYLSVTGSQLASKRLLPADNLQRQFEDRLVELKNDMEVMFLYGALNNSANGGTYQYVRSTQGFQNYISNSTAYGNGVIDYATKAVTEDAINTLMAAVYTNGVDMTDPFILCAHPTHIRTINSFGADKVRITQDETKWGRSLKVLETDLGVDIELVPVMNMSKSDLFIIDLKKVGLAEFRPFVKWEWGADTNTPDGTDAWKQRYLGEYGVKVVDGTKSHAAIQYITW